MRTKPADWMEKDDRFKAWAKKTSTNTVDLDQKNGYSLTGQWVKWNETIVLNPGECLVIAAEHGSRKSHSYCYALVTADGKVLATDWYVMKLKALMGPISHNRQQKQQACE